MATVEADNGMAAGPSLRSALRRTLIRQFGKPTGAAGVLAGWIMRRRASNVIRNRWTVDLMDLRPGHDVLEIGYGPGFALELALARIGDGTATGLDHSDAMRRMAGRRNRRAIAEGRLTLCAGAVETGLDDIAGPFDRIYGVNVVMFWAEPVRVLRALRGRLAAHGRILLTVQPRTGAKTAGTARAYADRLAGQMAEAGMTDTSIHVLKDIAPPAVCVIGHG